MGAFDRVLAQVLPLVPRALVGRVSARYIAGESAADALRTVATLNASGFRATVDVLGEFVGNLAEAQAACAEYVGLLDAFEAQKLDTQASVKLTQLGLKLDAGTCRHLMQQLVEEAERHGNLITIDMEDSSCTDATLDIFETLRKTSAHVGVVLQSCLRRSTRDLERLLPLAPNVRICKGIYVEPAAIAFQERDEVRQNFLELVEMLLTSEGFVGIATHDEVLVRGSRELLRRHESDARRYEFQMLLGVRDELRRRLLAEGHPVRVYVPYGSQWYAYSMRRLKENPAIAGHVFRNLLGA